MTLGLATAGRFSWRGVGPYLVAQFVGAAVAGALLLAIAAGGRHAHDLAGQFAAVSTGYGELSPGGFNLTSMLLVEIITTAIFVWVIIGVTSKRAVANLAPLAIGLTLTLVAIPVSNGSFNPARSLASALYGGAVPLEQLWASFVAPIVGALLAGASFKVLFDGTKRRG